MCRSLSVGIIVKFILAAIFSLSVVQAYAKPPVRCGKNNDSICKMTIVMPLEKWHRLKNKKLDLSVYFEEKEVYRVEKYKVNHMRFDRQRQLIVANVTTRGDWYLPPEKRQSVLEQIIMARSEDLRL